MSILDVLTKHADTFRQKTGVTNKLSIPEMTNLMASLKWGQSNLLKGTSDQYKTITGQGWLGATSSTGINCIPVNVGETYTYAATIKNTFGAVLGLQLWSLDKNQLRIEYLEHSTYIDNGIEKQIVVTATIKNANTKYLQFGVYSDNTQQNTHSFQVKNERLYLGEAPGIWTPNPADKVGGVVSLVLSALLPVRGCFA